MVNPISLVGLPLLMKNNFTPVLFNLIIRFVVSL